MVRRWVLMSQMVVSHQTKAMVFQWKRTSKSKYHYYSFYNWNLNLFYWYSFFFSCAFDNFSPCTSGSVIPEENVDEFVTSSDQTIPNMNGIRTGSSSGSLSLPIQSQQHQQSYRTESPQSAYSPYGNSPVIDQPNSSGYMMMSPGTDYNKGYVIQ